MSQMPKTVARIGPGDHGRRMSLDDFESAEGADGFLYELGRGAVTVVDVPDSQHLAQVDEIREQFYVYKRSNPGRIHRMGSGSDCKILLADLVSERHPDWVVYKTPPPAAAGATELWSTWIPEIVIEVVSVSSRHRDYEEKPEEYRQFGVKEYWIVDAERREMLVLRRSKGRWSEQVVRPDAPYASPLLPSFSLDLAPVFAAAADAAPG